MERLARLGRIKGWPVVERLGISRLTRTRKILRNDMRIGEKDVGSLNLSIMELPAELRTVLNSEYPLKSSFLGNQSC